MYDTVLTATDGSRAATDAVAEAIQTTALYNAKLRVIHVIDTSSFPESARTEGVLDDLEAEAERNLAEIVADAEAEHVSDVETALREGSPHEEILAYADEVDADLLVLGARGVSGYDESYLGSVAEHVARGTDRPLLLI